MMQHSKQQTALVAALALSLCLCISTLAGAQEPEATDAGSTGGQPGSKGGIWPMVSVDKQENKSRVDVHVPVFFDMTNDKDDEDGKSKLDLSVLSGLVTVSRDRAPAGQSAGPLTVTVFGLPVYNGKGSKVERPPRDSGSEPAVKSSSQKPVASSLHESLGNAGGDAGRTLFNAVRQANERAMNSLADIFGRLSSMARQAGEPKANINGPAASSESLDLFKSSRFQPQDFEPKQPVAAAVSNSLAGQ